MLTLQVKEQIIENLTPDEKFIRGTVGAKCQIKFDEFWSKYEKTVVFQRKCQKPINIIVNELDNEIEIPYEILEKHGKFKIGVFGIIENEVLPTLWSTDIEILCGTDTHGTNPQTYTPNEIDQLRLSKQDKLTAGDNITIDENNVISASGTTDYALLENKPQINGVELLGNKSLTDLGIYIPTKTSELENDSGFIDDTAFENYYTKTEVDEKTVVDQTYNKNSQNAQSGIAVAEALSGYVMAEVGKGLSSNDFTNEDKEKLYSALQNENIDKTYNPTSENAQSGLAVAEAVASKADKTEVNKLKGDLADLGFYRTINGTANSGIYIPVNVSIGDTFVITNNTNGTLYSGVYDSDKSRTEIIPDIGANSSIKFTSTTSGSYIQLYFESSGNATIENSDKIFYKVKEKVTELEVANIDFSNSNYIDNLITDFEQGFINDVGNIVVDSNNITTSRFIDCSNGYNQQIVCKRNKFEYIEVRYYGESNNIPIGKESSRNVDKFTINPITNATRYRISVASSSGISKIGYELLIKSVYNIPSKIKNLFNCDLVKKDKIKYPFDAFWNYAVIYNVDDFQTDDWRKSYVGLGYDVVYNDIDNMYYMVYSGNNGELSQIGVATSTDLINWTDNQSNPVLSPSTIPDDYDYGGATFPQLLWFDNKWIMFYVAFSSKGFEQGIHTIAYAESNDLINWTKKGVLFGTEVFTSAGYNIGVMYRPRVRNYFGKYYMFINAGEADASPNGSDESIYVLVSDNPLKDWKLVGCAIDAKVESAESSYKMCADPDVIFNGEYFVMTYWGGGRNNQWAYSRLNEFPLVWHKFEGGEAIGGRPLLIPTNDSMWLITNEVPGKIVKIYRSKLIN